MELIGWILLLVGIFFIIFTTWVTHDQVLSVYRLIEKRAKIQERQLNDIASTLSDINAYGHTAAYIYDWTRLEVEKNASVREQQKWEAEHCDEDEERSIRDELDAAYEKRVKEREDYDETET